MSESAASRGLSARDIVVGYGKNDPILEGLSLDVLPGELTVIVGPNACGKSTLLRSLARVLGVRRGVVELDGRSVADMNQKALARRLGLLAQSSVAPGDIWIAMSLAQATDILLLDEPTTYLDLNHQLEVLRLAQRLHRDGVTVVAVLHDLHLAFRYATHLVFMKDGEVVAQGEPRDVVTADLIERVFSVPCRIIDDPETGSPLVIPTR